MTEMVEDIDEILSLLSEQGEWFFEKVLPDIGIPEIAKRENFRTVNVDDGVVFFVQSFIDYFLDLRNQEANQDQEGEINEKI